MGRGVREDSKAPKILGLRTRPDGASLKELMKARAGWRILCVDY